MKSDPKKTEIAFFDFKQKSQQREYQNTISVLRFVGINITEHELHTILETYDLISLKKGETRLSDLVELRTKLNNLK